jgi:hypothetical protein
VPRGCNRAGASALRDQGARKSSRLPRYRGLVPLFRTCSSTASKAARLFTGIKLFRRQHDQAQRTVIRHVAVRGEDMRAIEEGRVTLASFLTNLRHAPAHFASLSSNRFLRSSISRRRLARVSNQITRRFLRLVAGGIQVVELVRQPVQRVGIERGRLPRLKTAQQNSRPVEATYARLRVATDDGALPKNTVRATRRAALHRAEARLLGSPVPWSRPGRRRCRGRSPGPSPGRDSRSAHCARCRRRAADCRAESSGPCCCPAIAGR